MKYDNIINEIDNLNAIDFTMDSFKIVGILSRTINDMYAKSLLENNDNARSNYEIARGHLRKTVSDILKDKLNLEDENIDRILCFMDFADYIEEIYLLKENIIVKLKMNEGNKEKETIYSFPNDAFYEVILNNCEENRLSNILNSKSKTKKLK